MTRIFKDSRRRSDDCGNRGTAGCGFAANFACEKALEAFDKAKEAMYAWNNLNSTKPDVLKLFAMAILLWPGFSGRG